MLRGPWTGDLERYVERALEMEQLSLCEGSIRGTWRGVGFFSGDFERQVERALVMEQLCRCRNSAGRPERDFFSLVTLKDKGGGGNLGPSVCMSVKPWRHSGILIRDPILWTLRKLEVSVWGQCATSLEGQGSYDLGLGRMHRGPVRPTSGP
jgi:hypothetical protein